MVEEGALPPYTAAVNMPGTTMKVVSEMRRIHIEFLGRLVKVRFARTAEDLLRHWDEISPGQVHDQTGSSYSDLRRLGEGLHDLRG